MKIKIEQYCEKTFKLSQNNTDIKTELIAGLTTFMTIAYILAVNPSILSSAGMDKGAVFTATALASLIGTLVMALATNYPFALAPGMGLNAFFAYTVVIQMGYTWQMALAAVFIEGIIFILLSLTNVREAIFNVIPMSFKYAVPAGIGLFIAFLGLQNAKIVVDSSTLVSVYSFKSSIENGTFNNEGITVVLALLGVVITGVLLVKKVKGNILIGILVTWVLGVICELTGLYVPNAELGMYSTIPDFSVGFAIPSIMPTLGQMDFSNVLSLDFFSVIFAFLFVDMFDTIGTLIGVASQANMLDKDGRLPKIKGALLADAIATTAGAVLGTSTTTSVVESASGVAEGGRTGLASVSTAILFGLALFLSPIFLAIPSFATAPALIVVGFMMLESVLKIDFADLTEAIPSYICMIAMPFMYSISEGIAMGTISYVIINLLTKKQTGKKLNTLLFGLAILFVLKYILI